MTLESGGTAGGRFTVTATSRPSGSPVQQGESVLRLTGELDHDSAPVLREAFKRCEDAGAARILVDCSGLDFCDSTGINLLLDARSRAQARDGIIALVGITPRVARVFEITGAATLFPRFASLAEARTAEGD
ncbi:STAS domain-containing protein [Streptacidiphilus sp. MAP5-3]|uniref:STAS domain-containing protein n=1 Tax=unclassified Streptacidiphilus TaxID=2643834 RepID=UPI003510E3B8